MNKARLVAIIDFLATNRAENLLEAQAQVERDLEANEQQRRWDPGAGCAWQRAFWGSRYCTLCVLLVGPTDATLLS